MKALAVLSLALLGSCGTLEKRLGQWAVTPQEVEWEQPSEVEAPVDVDNDGEPDAVVTVEVPQESTDRPNAPIETVAQGAAALLSSYGPLGVLAGLALTAGATSVVRRKQPQPQAE